jgi:hypothetical protein
MRHVRRTGALFALPAIAFLVGGTFGVGVAWASHGHRVNGIYHGPYFEYRSGDDYHHNWTEHGHDGYRWVASYKSNGTRMASASNSGSNYQTEHVHVTTRFNSPGYGRYKTNNPNSSNQCTGEQGTSSYGDGHGICYHRMDEGAE